MAYDNTNTGIIKRNDKGDNPQRPDYKGSLDVDGKQYWVAGWVRKRKDDGTPFLSIKIEAKEQQPAAAPAASDPSAPPPPDGGEFMPF